MPANHPQGKAVEIEAKWILEQEGYQVLRAVAPAPFDLIAWKSPSTILCLSVRRSRSVSINGYSKCVNDLSELVRSGKAPGECQFWIKYPSFWKRFEILPGGALLIKEGTYDRDQVCA